MFDCLNRDISWLAFNERVLEEVDRSTLPLQERASYLGITRSNLDEFIQTRYPATLDMYDEAGLEQFRKAITSHYAKLSNRWYYFSQSNSAIFPGPNDLMRWHGDWVKSYFRKTIYPTLQPVTVTRSMDPRNTVNVFVITRDDKDVTHNNFVEIPRGLPRFVVTPDGKGLISMEDLIILNLDYLFKGVKIIKSCAFRILRSAEVYVQTDEFKDQYELIEQTLKEREKSWITMLEIGTSSVELVDTIKKLVPITTNTLTFVTHPGPVGLSSLKGLPDAVFAPEDRSRSFTPVNPFPTNQKVMDYIKERDRLVFHPYESYRDTFVRFIEEAAENPDVISIKITLYRVANKSRIIDALIKAAENGKQVTVLVELKARFDEKHNIQISRILKEAGVRLVYGSPTLKTHAKLCLVSAIEPGGNTVVYSHIATGNYNESNAKIYTDYSYFTADRVIGDDLGRFFNLLTSVQEKFKSKKLFYAPYNLRQEIEDQIEAQVKLAKKKKPAKIIFKCNSLTDDKISKVLVNAANAGVKITLIVRGACVVPHTPNIEVISIVGRFLEHSRIYLFGTGDNESIYIGSNDIMHRNLNRRNELMLMVEPPELKRRIKTHLKMYLDDTENSRVRIGDYEYIWNAKQFQSKRYDCQQKFISEAKKMSL